MNIRIYLVFHSKIFGISLKNIRCLTEKYSDVFQVILIHLTTSGYFNFVRNILADLVPQIRFIPCILAPALTPSTTKVIRIFSYPKPRSNSLVFDFETSVVLRGDQFYSIVCTFSNYNICCRNVSF